MVILDLLVRHPHYVEDLAQWMFKEWGHFYPRATQETTKRWVSKTMQNTGLPLTMVALDEQKLVGFAMVQRQELYREKGITPWLGGLLVKKDYQRQGIGTRLHQWTLTHINALGYKKMYLLVFDPLLCEWYKNRGWTIIKTDEAREHPLIIMETTLDCASRPST